MIQNNNFNKWHQVEILNSEDFSQMFAWLEDEFGDDVGEFRWRFIFDLEPEVDKFIFRRKEDAILFALRWR